MPSKGLINSIKNAVIHPNAVLQKWKIAGVAAWVVHVVKLRNLS